VEETPVPRAAELPPSTGGKSFRAIGWTIAAVVLLGIGLLVFFKMRARDTVLETRPLAAASPTVALSATPLATSAPSIVRATASPPSLPPIAPSPGRQELLKAAMAGAEKYEDVQDWPQAVAAYVRLQKDFPGSEVGKVRLELLLSKLQSEPGALSDENVERMRDALTEAAKLDVVGAMEVLGDFLRKRDSKASFDWLCAAAAHGRAQAMTKVGLLFSNGTGVARDFVKAAEWFELARQAGDISAATLLAECYLLGKGVAKNEAKAINLLKDAAAAKDPRAMDQLATSYHKGIGVARDDGEAFRLYNSAAKLNYLDSLGNLGVLYLTSAETDLGKNEILRTQKAISLFREGAKQNNAFCMFLYARCLEAGNGVTVNLAEATDWYRRAAEAGNRSAQEWCRQHNVSLNTEQVP
jgi:TPR repeat protein